MSRPRPGPSTPTPPPGPKPKRLTGEQRADRYRRQTGTARLTPRQRRRIKHKSRGA